MWHFFSWSVLRLTRPEKLASRGCHVRLIHSCQQKNTANTSWQHTEITAYNVNTRQPGAFLRLQTTYPLRGSSEASGVQRPGSPTQVLSGNFSRLDLFSGLSRHVQTAVDWHLLVSPYFILLHLLPQDPFKNLYDSLVNATSWLQQICSIGPHPTLPWEDVWSARVTDNVCVGGQRHWKGRLLLLFWQAEMKKVHGSTLILDALITPLITTF